MSRYISRATFLRCLALASVGAVGKLAYDSSLVKRDIPCTMLGPSRNIGHAIRNHVPAAASANTVGETVDIAIVGGGIAGLSAGWWLLKHGIDNFVILELEREAGGNATSGQNKVSAYPRGAHYVPLANAESSYVIELFKELGIITGTDKNGGLIYNEEYLCHELEERLLKDGAFQDGLVPKRGLQDADREQIGRFFQTVGNLRKKVGRDGKPAFAIPLDLSSQDPELIALDAMSMHDWLAQNNFDSRPLRWYVNYCCRDDYGSTLENVSAWAGIHYFAGRRGTAANAEPNWVVTWPEGNGFLVSQLKQKLAKHIRVNSPVARIEQHKKSVALTLHGANPQNLLQAKYAIFCAPRFIAKHVILPSSGHDKGSASHPDGADLATLSYAPWMVANVTVRSVPDSRGVGLAWDNVSYNSPSLGYVVATHQAITTRATSTVLTYYYPMSDEQPHSARGRLQDETVEYWRRFILADLEQMHPGITTEISEIELWPWGHGMIRPSVGYIWGATRRQLQVPQGRVYFAHSDMSGVSNFEEAQYQGVTAAKKVIAELKTA